MRNPSNYLILLSITIITLGCVQKSKYDSCVEDKIEQSAIIDSLNSRLKFIEQLNYSELIHIYGTTISKKDNDSQIIYTEKDGLNALHDYYNFYRRGCTFNDPYVRKISENTFHVSLLEENTGFPYLLYKKGKKPIVIEFIFYDGYKYNATFIEQEPQNRKIDLGLDSIIDTN